ncbi:MAG: hypothetical protein LBG69_00980 [Zoogloeaceae bacterium]|jgi:hypothetical protein|nr:hypothetical protein [Zoogloeaceae bacterium]
MTSIPKVKKSFVSVLTKNEKVRQTVVGIVLCGAISAAAPTPAQAAVATPEAPQLSQTQAENVGPVLLTPAQTASAAHSDPYHYSHSSHSSHHSHHSHYSSRD